MNYFDTAVNTVETIDGAIQGEILKVVSINENAIDGSVISRVLMTSNLADAMLAHPNLLSQALDAAQRRLMNILEKGGGRCDVADGIEIFDMLYVGFNEVMYACGIMASEEANDFTEIIVCLGSEADLVSTLANNAINTTPEASA